jgi:hypothetical protein
VEADPGTRCDVRGVCHLQCLGRGGRNAVPSGCVLVRKERFGPVGVPRVPRCMKSVLAMHLST